MRRMNCSPGSLRVLTKNNCTVASHLIASVPYVQSYLESVLKPYLFEPIGLFLVVNVGHLKRYIVDIYLCLMKKGYSDNLTYPILYEAY